MINEHRYILEKGSKKYRCPDCGKKTFVRYLDTSIGKYLPDQYGRCDREVKCSYHLNPYRDGYSKMVSEQERGKYLIDWKPQRPTYRPKQAPKPEPIFIPVEVFKQTLKPEGYKQNVFIQNLLSRVSFPFETKDIEKVISQYYLGTVCNGYRAGAISFPFIDKDGNVRAIQVKQFDETNHTTGTDFIHSMVEKYYQKKNEMLPGWLEAYQKNETKVSCLFGEHLLNKYTLNPIALVEAPKTAIYGTLYFGFPDQPKNLLWMAVYNLSSLSFDKCKALQGRNVYLFPDLSKDGKAFQLWSNKAKELSDLIPGTIFKVSDLLETLAPNELKESGADIADVLIKMAWQKFRPQHIEQPTLPKSVKGVKSVAVKTNYLLQVQSVTAEQFKQEPCIKPIDPARLESWEQEIIQLEIFFQTAILPTDPIKLNQYSTITNVSKFVDSHFARVKTNNGKRTFLSYLHRLQELKQYLTTNTN